MSVCRQNLHLSPDSTSSLCFSVSSIEDSSYHSSVSTVSIPPLSPPKTVSLPRPASLVTVQNSQTEESPNLTMTLRHYTPLGLEKLTLEDIDSLSINQIDDYFQILACSKVNKSPSAVEHESASKIVLPIAIKKESEKKAPLKKVVKAKNKKDVPSVETASKSETPPKNPEKRVLRSTAKLPKRADSITIKSEPEKHEEEVILIQDENISPKVIIKRAVRKQKGRAPLPVQARSDTISSSNKRRRSVTNVSNVSVDSSHEEKKSSKSSFIQMLSNIPARIFNHDSSSSNKAKESTGVLQPSLLRPRDITNNGGEAPFPPSNATMTPDRHRRMQEIAAFKGTFQTNFNERRNQWERRSFRG